MEVLAKEVAGKLPEGIYETEVLNPVTGKPYIFNPTTRELAMDDEYLALDDREPLSVPEVER
jgi:hypothetical protein